ncbi:MAG TPA: NAD(+)/NADH kinase [Thermoleophilaceae bacterium]
MRLALVVHPSRPVTAPLETLERWAGERALDVVQIPTDGGSDRELAPEGELEDGDLVVTLGGDGTVLSGLRAAAPVDAPVLGVACGSLGALTAVRADRLEDALERFRAGDWTARKLPALAIRPTESPDAWAVNDFVVVRHGAGQAVLSLFVDDDLYVRLAGDGLIIATPLGSSAYSMAAGGPVLAPGTPAVVCTPVAMHGGSAPPLVVPAGAQLRVEVQESFAGFETQIDGHNTPMQDLEYRVSLEQDMVTLVAFDGDEHMLTGLRDRGLISDSPRVLARDTRGAAR